MKKILIAAILFTLSTITVTASNIADYMVSRNSYCVLYFDAGKLQGTKIYTAIKNNLLSKFASSDVIAAIYPSGAANGLSEKDLSEIAFSVDLIQVQNTPQKKETISYIMAFKLNKEISQDSVIKIITGEAPGKSKLTTRQIEASSFKVTEIESQGNSLFVFMPDKNTLFASDYLDSIVALATRYIGKKPIALPGRLIEQKKLVSKDSTLYVIAAVLPAIRSLLEEEDGKIQPDGQPQSPASSLRNIIKNLIGATLTVSASDKLTVNTTVMFRNADAANTLNGLINQYMPLLKIQIFMMAKSNTQLPFLNTISNGVKGKNFVLNFTLGADDIAGILNLSSSNQKIGQNTTL